MVSPVSSYSVPLYSGSVNPAKSSSSNASLDTGTLPGNSNAIYQPEIPSGSSCQKCLTDEYIPNNNPQTGESAVYTPPQPIQAQKEVQSPDPATNTPNNEVSLGNWGDSITNVLYYEYEKESIPVIESFARLYMHKTGVECTKDEISHPDIEKLLEDPEFVKSLNRRLEHCDIDRAAESLANHWTEGLAGIMNLEYSNYLYARDYPESQKHETLSVLDKERFREQVMELMHYEYQLFQDFKARHADEWQEIIQNEKGEEIKSFADSFRKEVQQIFAAEEDSTSFEELNHRDIIYLYESFYSKRTGQIWGIDGTPHTVAAILGINRKKMDVYLAYTPMPTFLKERITESADQYLDIVMEKLSFQQAVRRLSNALYCPDGDRNKAFVRFLQDAANPAESEIEKQIRLFKENWKPSDSIGVTAPGIYHSFASIDSSSAQSCTTQLDKQINKFDKYLKTLDTGIREYDTSLPGLPYSFTEGFRKDWNKWVLELFFNNPEQEKWLINEKNSSDYNQPDELLQE